MTALVPDTLRALLAVHGGNLWVLILAPLLTRALLPRILAVTNRMIPGSPWRERVAFCAAIAPGMVFLSLAPFTLNTVHLGGSYSSWTCFLHCYIFVAAFLIAPVRAGFLVYRSHSRVSRLLAAAEDAAPRLARLGAELRLPVLELPTNDAVCLVAGVFKSRVCVSRGLLRMLTDDELRAALLHERSHWRRRETLRVSLAAFLNQCSILPFKRALDAYRQATEFSADREAVKGVHPLTLASVLLAVARCRMNSPGFVNLACRNLTERVSFLLGAGPRLEETCWDKVHALLLLGMAASLALVPQVMVVVARILCAGTH